MQQLKKSGNDSISLIFYYLCQHKWKENLWTLNKHDQMYLPWERKLSFFKNEDSYAYFECMKERGNILLKE